jgi:hypothetical protein
MRERDSGPTEAVNTFDLASEGLTSCGIALRISTNLKDPLVGFQFGRNADKCDFPVGAHEPGRRVSNIHFRIYINEHCVIMIEDQSTNGTVVDNTLLKAKEKENNMAYKHTLQTGQKIVLTGSNPRDDYTFMVWVPNRSDDAELAYQQNVTRFFLQQKAYREEVRARRPRQNGNPVRHLILMNVNSLTNRRSICFQHLLLLLRTFSPCLTLVRILGNGKAAANTTESGKLVKVPLLQFTR